MMMKKTFVFTLLGLLCLSVAAGGGKEKYLKAMKDARELMSEAKSVEDLQNCANRFERIGNAEKKVWLPKYYTALCYNNMVYMTKDMDKIDPILDKAQEYVDKAGNVKKLSQEDLCEIWVLKGMILGSRIMVDPQTRGMIYGPQSGMMYQKALGADGNNPRALSMSGQNTLFTPEQFGGGKEKAIPMMEKALKSFDSWKKPSENHPDWGKDWTEKLLKGAKGEAPMPWEEAPEEGKGEEHDDHDDDD